MKQTFVCLLTTLFLFSVSSCKKHDGGSNGNGNGGGGGSTEQSIDVTLSDTTSLTSSIPSLPVSLDFTAPPMQLDTFATKVDQYLTPYKVTRSQITKVVLKSLSLGIENAPGQTFNFVKDSATSIRVYVDSFAGTAPIEVAYRTSVPRNLTTMDMTVDPVDFKNTFQAQYMKLLVGFRTQPNEAVVSSTKFRVNYTFTISFKP